MVCGVRCPISICGRKEAREVARESLVLLKNRLETLPLKKSATSFKMLMPVVPPPTSITAPSVIPSTLAAAVGPHYHYAELAKQLIDEGFQIVLFGSAKDHEAGNEILAALTTEQQAWCRNLAGETQLEQAVVLIAACKAVVSNDSGLMHVAAALDRPLVALYGPSSPDFTPPLSHKARVIRLISGYHKVRKGDAAEGYHQSLIDITPQRVLEELNDLLLEKTEQEEA